MANKGKNKAAPRRTRDEYEEHGDEDYLFQSSMDVANALGLRKAKKQHLAEGTSRLDHYQQEIFDDDAQFDYGDLEDDETEDGIASTAGLQASYDELAAKLDRALAYIAQHQLPAPSGLVVAPTALVAPVGTTAHTAAIAPDPPAAPGPPAPPVLAPHANEFTHINGPAPWYPVPEKKTEVTTNQVRSKMRLTDDQIRWLQFRMKCRDTSVRGGIDITKPWSQQPLDKLILVLDTIRDAFPECQWFANNWAARFIVQEIFNHRRQHWMLQERKARRLPEPDPNKPRRGRKKKAAVLPIQLGHQPVESQPEEPQPAGPQAGPSQANDTLSSGGNATASASSSNGRKRSAKPAAPSGRVLRSRPPKA